MRHFILTLILVTSAALSAAETTELPTDAAKAIAHYDADVLKLKEGLITTLQKAQEAATKKGDLDAALAIKAKIASLGGSTGKPAAKAELTPMDRIVGVWAAKAPGYAGVWTFKPNKTVTRPDDRGGSFKIVGTKVVITWLSGSVETFNLPATDEDTSTTDDVGHLHLDKVADADKPKTSESHR